MVSTSELTQIPANDYSSPSIVGIVPVIHKIHSGYANTKPTHQQGNWEEGDFVMHVPGLELNQRAEILKNTKII